MPKKIFIFSILFLGLIYFSSAQDTKQLPAQEQNYYSLTGNQNDPQLTTQQPQPQQFSAEKTKVLADLRQARLNHNESMQRQLEARLNEIDNVTPVTSTDEHQAVSLGLIDKEIGQLDFNNATIAGLSHWNTATATVTSGPQAGRVYVCAAQYNASGSDTIRIYYTTNGGVSWSVFSGWFYNNFNIDYRANEMDIEILNDGTNTWLFGVTAYNDIAAGNVRVNFWRFNLTAFAFYSTGLSFPGANATNLYYNPRIATDEVIYGGGAFVYVTCSFDTTEGATHHLRQKFVYTTNPYAAAPTYTYRGNIWWNGSGYPSTAYYYNDICYQNPTGVDRVFTVISVNVTYNDLYLAWSNDYGATAAGLISLTESTPTRGATLASVVAANNLTMMLINKSNFSGSDWDIEYHVTTTGGTTTGAWTQGYVDFTGYQASGYPNVIWVRGTTNNFKCAYTSDSLSGTTRAMYAGWNGTAWASPSRLALSTIEADSTFACPVAGYRNGGGDNCLEVWSGQTVGVINASYLCTGTVGINGNNNGIPEIYSLSQNYPNPFNPATSIDYALPKAGFVKMEIYDITGQLVTTLVNSIQDAGFHTVNFDASNIASGMYFYKIEAGDFKDTKKMVLIK